MNRRSLFIAVALLLAVFLFARTSRAQGESDHVEDPASFYRVYQYDTPLTGWLEMNLWSTCIPRSDLSYDHFGQEHSRNGLFAHSIEAEYGLTDHLSVAGYADFEDPHYGDFEFTRGRIEARYRFAQRYDWPINIGLYAEYYFPRHDYSDSQEIETRIILDKDFNDFRVVLNPTLSKATTGSESSKQVMLSADAGIYWRRYLSVQPGIEYYADFGEIGKMPGFSKQHHVIFGTVDLHLTRNWTWHIGVGAGLTAGSDEVITKSILTYEFDAIRPTKLFPRHEVVP